MRNPPSTKVVSLNERSPAPRLTIVTPSRPPRRRNPFRGIFHPFVWAVVLPTLLTGIYYGFVASPRYVSEARIVLKQSSSQVTASGLSSFLKLAGISSGSDDISLVQTFLQSRSAIKNVEARVPIKTYYSERGGDWLARWPNIIYGPSDEEFFRYYQTMVKVIPNADSGVLTVQVQAFRPDEAKAIAAALVDVSEDRVNLLNERLRNDAIKTASDEVKRSEDALVTAQVAVKTFRNQKLIIDPEKNATLNADLIGKLNTELADDIAQIAQLKVSAPQSPQLPVLETRVASLKEQVLAQRQQVNGGGADLADTISEYERLNLAQQFATRRLTAAVAALQLAEADARRKQIFLERVVEPNLPDYSTMPQGIVNTITVFGWAMLLFLVVWILGAGFREHSVARRA